MEKKMNNKGFSLVELIIVIAIMAVLVGVLAPTYLKFVERSRKSTDVQNVAEIVTALQVYASDPMVTDTMTGGTITLKTTTQTAAQACQTGTNLDKALTAAGITNVSLKSSKWGDSDITLTVTVEGNGSVTVAESGFKAGSDYSLLNGKYD